MTESNELILLRNERDKASAAYRAQEAKVITLINDIDALFHTLTNNCQWRTNATLIGYAGNWHTYPTVPSRYGQIMAHPPGCKNDKEHWYELKDLLPKENIIKNNLEEVYKLAQQKYQNQFNAELNKANTAIIDYKNETTKNLTGSNIQNTSNMKYVLAFVLFVGVLWIIIKL